MHPFERAAAVARNTTSDCFIELFCKRMMLLFVMMMKMVISVPNFCRSLKMKTTFMTMRLTSIFLFLIVQGGVENAKLGSSTATERKNQLACFVTDCEIDFTLNFTRQRHCRLRNVGYFCCCWLPAGDRSNNAVGLSPEISFCTRSQYTKNLWQPSVRSIGIFPTVWIPSSR